MKRNVYSDRSTPATLPSRMDSEVVPTILTDDGVLQHSDRASQYLSIHYTERLAKAGFESSAGAKGGSDDNAMAESVMGRLKRRLAAIKVLGAPSSRVNIRPWFGSTGTTQKRLHIATDYVSTTEFEMTHYERQTGGTSLKQNGLLKTRGDSV